MAAVMHAALVAREQERRERLRPDREAKHLVAEDTLGHELADGCERAVGAFGLPVVLDRARGKASGGLAVDETRARDRGAHCRDLVGREHMADHDLHPGSSACWHDRRAPSNMQLRPPAKGALGPPATCRWNRSKLRRYWTDSARDYMYAPRRAEMAMRGLAPHTLGDAHRAAWGRRQDFDH